MKARLLIAVAGLAMVNVARCEPPATGADGTTSVWFEETLDDWRTSGTGSGECIDQYKQKLAASARANDLRWNNRIGFFGNASEPGDADARKGYFKRRFDCRKDDRIVFLQIGTLPKYQPKLNKRIKACFLTRGAWYMVEYEHESKVRSLS